MIEAGLDQLETAFAKIVDGPLPVDADWLDHLDILDAVRLSNGRGMPEFDGLIPGNMIGYVAPGIPASDVTYPGFPRDENWALICDHELLPEYLRAPAVSLDQLRTRLRARNFDEYVTGRAIEWASSVMGLGKRDRDAVAALLGEVHRRPILHLVASWWDSIPNSVSLTPVGRSLATANAFRLGAGDVLPGEPSAPPA
jgi:hypothetical protein